MKRSRMRVPVLHRHYRIPTRAIDVESRLVRNVTFSTETPARRWYGTEILDHAEKSVDLSYLTKVGSVLLYHDSWQPVAHPSHLRIVQKRGRADMTFGTKQLADDAFVDVQEKIIRGISVGYLVEKIVLEAEEDGKPPLYRVMRWQPLEFSLTPVPLDAKSTTGIRAYRAARQLPTEEPTFRDGDPEYWCEVLIPEPRSIVAMSRQRGDRTMKCEFCGRDCGGKCKGARRAAAAGNGGDRRERHERRPARRERERARERYEERDEDGNVLVRDPETGHERARWEHLEREHQEEGAKTERERVLTIGKLARQHSAEELGERAVSEGWSLERFKDAVLEDMTKREEAGEPLRNIVDSDDTDIGMDQKEVERFSFLRLINALANPSDRSAQAKAQLELEASQAQGEKLGRDPKGAFIPNDVTGFGRSMDTHRRWDSVARQRGQYGRGPTRPSPMHQLRAVSATSEGADLISDMVMGDRFIDLLRNNSLALRMGTSLTGLTSDIRLPRAISGVTGQWVTEGSSNEDDPVFDHVPAAPKSLNAFTKLTRKLLVQSSVDVEMWVRNELGRSAGLAMDLAAFQGSGIAPIPRGILNEPGIGDVPSLGTPGWDEILALWTGPAQGNALAGGANFIGAPRVIAYFMGKPKSGDWPMFIIDNFQLLGYPVEFTNQVPAAVNEGVFIFGDFSQLVICEWGALDLLVDPYTEGMGGTIRVRVLHEADVVVRHPQAFSAMQDIQ